MSEQGISQDFRGEALEHVFMPADAEARATVIIVPTVMGVTDLDRGFAGKLNESGFHAFIADLFGKAFRGADRDTMFGEMGRLKGDREALRDRMLAVLESAREQQGVDAGRIAAIGFCFGGLCVLDLARAGAAVRGVISFHGLFAPPQLEQRPITARVMAYHGWDDPMVPPDQVVALGTELTKAGVDWQIHAFGNTKHAFMVRDAKRPEAGIVYDERAAKRAWQGAQAFLEESLAG